MRAPDQHWAKLVALLPTGTDHAWFRSELDLIKAQGSRGLEQQRSHFLDRVRICDEALLKLPIGWDEIVAYRVACQSQADFIDRRRRQWKLWQYVDALMLAKRTGIALGYTSKSVPHGDGVAYLQAIAAFLGAPLGPHRAGWLLKKYGKMQPVAAALHGTSSLRVNVIAFDASGRVRP
jgi:hypothetical protein